MRRVQIQRLGVCLPPSPDAIFAKCVFVESEETVIHQTAANREMAAVRIFRTIELSAGELKALYHSRGWRVVTRRKILARDPLCQIGVLCVGRAPSVEVDHVIPAPVYVLTRGDVAFFFDAGNLRGSCHADRAYKMALEARGLWDESQVARLAALSA